MASEVTPANEIKFENFCGLLEKIFKKKRQRRDQDTILENFINDFKLSASQTVGNKNSSIFPILRLLLPKLERKRSSYNLKETKLGALLVKVLSLPKQSRDAQKLLSFRSVNTTAENDFAGVAYFVVKSRLNAACNTFTIGDINQILDEIASAEAGNKAAVLDAKFSFVVNKLSPDQLKWFLRIILKDLKLEMSHKRILAIFHPDAPEYYENCSDLYKVCEELGDGDARPLELGIQMFSAASPMLSERLDIQLVHKLPDHLTYQIENKFDGERFQLHMENGVFEYFSRRGHKYSSNYGSTYESGLLTPHLRGCFKPGVESFVLDGEMMGWHKEGQYFGCKGMSFDIKKITESSKYRPCFCAFDVLYYNGRTLAGAPERGGVSLAERRAVLDDMFHDVPGVILRSERHIVRDRSEILAALNRAIDNRDEGIVVKDVASYYIPNKRNVGWYKIKPEYTEGATDDLDMVIIGADEAQNKRQGRARSFLVACADADEPGQPPCRWVGVGRVSSGLSEAQRDELCALLQRHWRRAGAAPPPAHLVFHKETPDWWLLPEHSVVLTIRATELIRSTSYGAGYTLRFPRVTRLRTDKPVTDVVTLRELHQLIASKGGSAVVKMSTTAIESQSADGSGGGAEVKVLRKRRAEAPRVAERFVLAPPAAPAPGAVTSESRALAGRKLCVLSDDEDCSLAELADIIRHHGGTVVANPGPDTWLQVAGRETRRVRAALRGGRADVAPSRWLRALAPARAPAALRPLQLLAVSAATRRALARDYDRFGDAYARPTDERELRACFQHMDAEDEVIHLTTQEMLSVDREVFGAHSPLSFLRGCRVHVAARDGVRAALAQMFGAAPAPAAHCTHAVLARSATKHEVEAAKRTRNTLVVCDDWLDACFAERRLVSVHNYLL